MCREVGKHGYWLLFLGTTSVLREQQISSQNDQLFSNTNCTVISRPSLKSGGQDSGGSTLGLENQESHTEAFDKDGVIKEPVKDFLL